MLTRRDMKLAAQAAQLWEARRIAADAVVLARRLRADNAALQKNIAVLQKPGSAAMRAQRSRHAADILSRITPIANEIQNILRDYNTQSQQKDIEP
jgi:hypothetical protein